VRFSPRLYSSGSKVYSVFAMGDNDGNISLFRLAKDMEDEDLKVLKLMKSHPKS
jgi:hypothetical protein